MRRSSQLIDKWSTNCSAKQVALLFGNLAAKTYVRSPYREQTRMVRVPVSLIPTVRKMLAQRKAEVAAGHPDEYV